MLERISIGSILNIRSLLGSQIVNNVTLLTRMAEVEKILNDRRLDLTPPTSDSKDPEPLSPSELLLKLLGPNVCLHPWEPSNADIYGSKRWKQAQVQSSRQNFRNVWFKNTCHRFMLDKSGPACVGTWGLETLFLGLMRILLLDVGLRQSYMKFFLIAKK